MKNVADIGRTRRSRSASRFIEAVSSARRQINAALDGLIEAVDDFATTLPGDAPIEGPDRTGGYELAAEITGYERRTIVELVSRGAIPYIPMPSGRGHRRSIRFSERDLRDWMHSIAHRPEAS